MSQHQEATYQCPNCGHEQEITIWESVNVQIDPEMKDKILNNEFFRQICSECNTVSQVYYTFLYHDMENSLMVYMIESDDTEEIKEEIENIKGIGDFFDYGVLSNNTALKELDDDYCRRIVMNYNELLEKICIAQSKLDDRIIEIMKLLYLNSLREQQENATIDTLLFYHDEEEGYIFICPVDDGETAVLDFDKKLYDSLKEKTEPVLAELTPKGFSQVDVNWAVEAMANL